jgi:hypothetical protein
MWRSFKLMFFLFVSFSFIGCVAPPRKQLTAQFNESEMVPFSKKGSSTVSGQAFLKTRGGEVRYGAGSWVQLIPSTAYTRELLRYLVDDVRVENTDGRWSSHVRSVQADGSGNFEFKDIPAGSYLLRCQIYWEVPSRYGIRETGADVLDSVTIGDGEFKKVILTKN